MTKNMPKYLALTEWITEQIRQGELRIGDKLLSENELRKKFSVSRQTVRQAASILENNGILERRRGSGTFIASVEPINRPRTMQIGVITTYLDDYIFPSIIKGIEQVLTQHGYNMQFAITYNKAENEMRILEKFLQQDIDGLIIEPTKSGLPNLNEQLYERLKSRHIPYLFINGYYPLSSAPYVAMDDYGCGKAAAEYLLARGHRDIAGIFKFDDIQGRLRYTGAAKAMQSYNGWSDERICWYSTEDIEDDSAEALLAKRLLKTMAGCTAAICYNDKLGRRVLDYLQRDGQRVPEDISLISFDNCADKHQPTLLTSFIHPKAELGRRAAEKLVQMIAQINAAVPSYLFEPKLAEGNSVRAV